MLDTPTPSQIDLIADLLHLDPRTRHAVQAKIHEGASYNQAAAWYGIHRTTLLRAVRVVKKAHAKLWAAYVAGATNELQPQDGHTQAQDQKRKSASPDPALDRNGK